MGCAASSPHGGAEGRANVVASYEREYDGTDSDAAYEDDDARLALFRGTGGDRRRMTIDTNALEGEDMAVSHAAHKSGRREGVSAGLFSGGEDAETGEAFTPPVHPKSRDAKKRLESTLRKNFIFSSLSEEAYTIVTDAMRQVRVEPGQVVIRQGTSGEVFYVVDQGTLDFFLESHPPGYDRNGQALPAGEDNVLTKVGEVSDGGSFGEVSLMYNTPRAATVTARTHGMLWELDQATFRHVVIEGKKAEKRMYEAFLRRVPLMSSLTDDERGMIADCLQPQTFSKGEYVIRQGEAGDKFYILESGEAVATMVPVGGLTPVDVMRYSKGSYFGEIALLTNEPRQANVIALSDALRLAAMDRKSFIRMLGPMAELLTRNFNSYERPALELSAGGLAAGGAFPGRVGGGLSNAAVATAAKGVLGDAGERERQRKRRAGISSDAMGEPKAPEAEAASEEAGPFHVPVHPKSEDQKRRIHATLKGNFLFASLEEGDYKLILDAFFETRVGAGDVIMRQGEQGDNFYVVESGEYEIKVSGDIVGVAENGGYFGELALMYNCPRAATVQARCDGLLWALDQRTFRHIVVDSTARRRATFQEFVSRVPILAPLSPHELASVADALTMQHYEDGDYIIRQGEHGESFHLMVEGTAEAVLRADVDADAASDPDTPDGRVVMTYEPGSYFGERALLLKEPRAASVIARGRAATAVMDRFSFHRLIGALNKAVAQELEDNIAKLYIQSPLPPAAERTASASSPAPVAAPAAPRSPTKVAWSDDA